MRVVAIVAVAVALAAPGRTDGGQQAAGTVAAVQSVGGARRESDPPQAVRVPLSGVIVDATGAPITGARVTVTSATGVMRASTVTNQDGRFMLRMTAGEHIVIVSSPGFAEHTQRVFAGQETPPLDITLGIAGFQASVNVDAAPGYAAPVISTATKTPTPLRDVPQAVTVVTQELIKSQLMTSIGDVMRYVPGITTHQGENNRDQVIIRGNSSSADFFVDGMRDDVQYFRDLYNLDRVEALKGPNAMIFGRGGGGGVVNRVTKEPGTQPVREFSLQAGSFGDRRVTGDFGQALSEKAALRLNAMAEGADSFRSGVDMHRYGINPTLAFAATPRTRVSVGYELVHDRRVADRGVPSFAGRPVDVDPSTYYGNADDTYVRATVNLASAMVEQRAGRFTVRNRTLLGHYDRGYQNYVPGAVSADRSRVSLTAYNNATERLNLFNQTDVTTGFTRGALRHTVLFGAELGRQATDNLRQTGFFNNTATALLVPYGAPTTTVPVTYRPNATDANNHLRTVVAAAYVQDQLEVSRWLQVLGGARIDRFELQYHNNRNGDDLSRVDTLLSPRAGVVVKPVAPLSVYGSYGVSYLPSSGDQFSSLTTITRQVEPERFTNYEAGAKWDVRPSLAFTTAVYRLDRSNTRATDPNDATRVIQTGQQRTNGYEAGISGRPLPLWRIAGGYAVQDAFIVSATTVAAAGATVAQVPRHTFTLWNDYQWHPRFNGGIGVQYRSDMFAAVDNAVTVPGYVRLDAALQVALPRGVRAQVNIENLLDGRYFINADNNTNISPGAPRLLKVALTTRF